MSVRGKFITRSGDCGGGGISGDYSNQIFFCISHANYHLKYFLHEYKVMKQTTLQLTNLNVGLSCSKTCLNGQGERITLHSHNLPAAVRER